MISTLLKILPVTVLLVYGSMAVAEQSEELHSILGKNQPPEGVVFEIVSDEPGLLGKLLPDIKNSIASLRERFPELPIAIVTHGKEQFDLTTNKQQTESKTHKIVKQLVDADGVDVHVCGTHAEWYGVMPEEFPDYVDVSAEGPAQIDDYEAMGYEVITLTD